MIIHDLNRFVLSESRLAASRAYFSKYYSDAFHEGQGLEKILETLRRYGTSGTWLDLGAGPSTLLWSIPLSGITSITCNDVYPEPLAVLDTFAQSGTIPHCYRHALRLSGKSRRSFLASAIKIKEYAIFDALRRWPSCMARKRYDLITEFGCFGLAPKGSAFESCFGYLRPYLARHGRVIGANWKRSSRYVANNGGDNSYLSCDLVRHGAECFGFRALHCETVSIVGDRDYDAVIIWAMEPQ